MRTGHAIGLGGPCPWEVGVLRVRRDVALEAVVGAGAGAGAGGLGWGRGDCEAAAAWLVVDGVGGHGGWVDGGFGLGVDFEEVDVVVVRGGGSVGHDSLFCVEDGCCGLMGLSGARRRERNVVHVGHASEV